MITPSYLKKGDRIAIISTARKVTPEELEPGAGMLRLWGLEVVYGENLFKAYNQFAGTDSERAADLQKMLDDSSVKAILFARGGYGTLRIVDRIDFTGFKKEPKWIAGFSDITVLHNHIHNLGIETIHSAMLFSFQEGRYGVETAETLRKALFGEDLDYVIPPCSALQRNGRAKGELVGGNLSLLYALTGSASDIDTRGKILFLEDLDEYLYHVDRMMLGLKRSGKLEGLAGLIVGGMTGMRDNPVPFGKTAEEIIRETVNEYNYPVCYNFPAGHVPDNRALMLGRRITMEVQDQKVKIAFGNGRA
jgi:muramoyltetrapeptide carboxypeptidase